MGSEMCIRDSNNNNITSITRWGNLAGAITKNVGTALQQVKKFQSELEKDLNNAVNEGGVPLGDEESLGFVSKPALTIPGIDQDDNNDTTASSSSSAAAVAVPITTTISDNLIDNNSSKEDNIKSSSPPPSSSSSSSSSSSITDQKKSSSSSSSSIKKLDKSKKDVKKDDSKDSSSTTVESTHSVELENEKIKYNSIINDMKLSHSVGTSYHAVSNHHYCYYYYY